TKPACATGKTRPSRHNDTMSKITGKLQARDPHQIAHTPPTTQNPNRFGSIAGRTDRNGRSAVECTGNFFRLTDHALNGAYCLDAA
ncbi:hypothetical protein ACFY15_36110, partial [Streptomyces sp. NPDC001373]|uniref:hypothetical protein n=1 Tax=Streptomyces sp. NPDC001373 TaxID=3364565 RepID=UPI0036D0E889